MSVPPEIVQYFDKLLLSQPVLRFGDSPDVLWDMYRTFCYRYLNKTDYCQRRKEKAMRGIKEFLEIYERIKAKEKELKGTPGDIEKRFSDYIVLPDRRSQDLFARLRNARYRTPKDWDYLPFQKI